MRACVTISDCGIIVHSSGKKISLDPNRTVNCDVTFVSHAHSDHLYRTINSNTSNNSKAVILTSKATSLIASARGYNINDIVEEHDGIQLIDNGHILGSKGLLIQNDLYYTADISIRRRAFMNPAPLPQVDTLIIESTFGRPQYIFPNLTEITHNANKIISEMYDKGIPVILMGYALGKAQLLTELFRHWDPLYVHDSVEKINSIYKKLGIPLRDAITYSVAENQGLLSKNKPWIMIAPLATTRSNFIKRMKERYGVKTVGFSGWAVDNRYKFLMNLDYTFPLSDHSDYNELIRIVNACNPRKIYTCHGFMMEFARSLRKLGFDAEPISNCKVAKKENHKKDLSACSLDFYIKTS